MTIEPIRPDQVQEHKHRHVIPEFVFEAFNFLISQNFSNGKARVKQSDVLARILSEVNSKRDESRKITATDIFDNNWLYIEDIYRSYGWDVEYDKPGYCESYGASWLFMKKED